MINGLIIYHHDDEKKNEWFIKKCLEELNDDNFSLIYKEESEVFTYLKDHQVSFAIYRARDFRLVERLEKLGIRCFNNSVVNKTANDKYETFLLAKKHDIPVLKTSLNKRDGIDFPCVLKSINGHGGNEVYLIKNLEDETKCLKQLKNKVIYQEYIENTSDVRLYVLNNEIIGAVKRENKNDFRSNYSLGGHVSIYEPNQEMKDIALKIAKILKSDYIGVDFIIDKNQIYLNEIEDPVGARMLYQTHHIDAIHLFVNDIKNKLIS